MAIKNVSFYGQGQRAPLGGGQIQSAYQDDPRRQIAQNLMQSGSSTAPVQSVTEGIARALSGAAGGYFAGEARRDLKEKEAAYSGNIAAMTQALVGGQPVTRPTPGFVGPMGQTKGGIQAALATLPQGAEYDSVRNQLGMQMYNDKRTTAAAQAARKQQLDDEARKRGFDVDDREDNQRAAIDLQNSKPDKFGSGYVGADSESPTGFSRMQVNDAGETRNLGPVAAPRAMFDENKGSKESRSKALDSRYETATENLREADNIMVDVNQMLELVGNVESGWGTEFRAEGIAAMKALGFKVDDSWLADVQTMRSKSMDFILKRISKTKGAISEKEMVAFAKASPGLANTQEANQRILGLASRVAERQKYVSQAIREGYGAEGMTRKKLDDIEIEARAQWDKDNGGVVSGGGSAKEQQSVVPKLTKEQEDLVNRNLNTGP